MCGIAGIISPKTETEFDLPSRMASAISHRGPDGQGQLLYRDGKVTTSKNVDLPWAGNGLFLVHQRLRILELSEAGWQPMSDQGNLFHIVFNGEIYNYKELRSELEQLGCQFVSNSDTEVLLQGYVAWGEKVLNRIVGMFAFCILDLSKSELLLARDPFGIKPLFYSTKHGAFAFASEIPALLECNSVSRKISPQAAYRYLRHGLTAMDELSLFEDIVHVPPAHFLKINLEAKIIVPPKRYWQTPIRINRDITFVEAKNKLRDLFAESVSLHMRSDVPVGAALSGGIDSSAVVSMMRRLSPNADIDTFSFISSMKSISEESWIDVINQSARTRGHKIKPGSSELILDLPKMIRAQAEPIPGTSIYAQYRVFKLAKERSIKVILDGQGADEYLGGYRFYLAARFAELVRKGQLQKALEFAKNSSQLPGMNLMTLLLRSGDFFVPRPFQEIARKMIGKNSFPGWLNKDWFFERNVTADRLFSTKGAEILHSILARTLEATSLPPLLRYEDRNSMAFSIESRVPFLTTTLVEFVLSLPSEYILNQEGTTKYVFREAMREIVPDIVLDRRDKIGFQTPEDPWMRELAPWVHQVLNSDTAQSLPMLRAGELRNEWSAIVQKKKPMGEHVWRIAAFIEWAQQFEVEH